MKQTADAAPVQSVAVRVETSLNAIEPALWQRLLALSYSNTIFLTWEWLQAWRQTLGAEAELVIPLAYLDGQLVGAMALEHKGRSLIFAARERSDYCDALISRSLPAADAQRVLAAMLRAVRERYPGLQQIQLNRVPEGSLLLDDSWNAGIGLHVTPRRGVEAPRMDMHAVEEKLRKKSLRRHANGLARRGRVEYQTLTCGTEITPLLNVLFDQHVRRWQGTDTPSLFTREQNRGFYRALTESLSETGALRFSIVCLDDVPVATHYGFCYAGTFTWYKPAFEPNLARLSPGEVLIKYLLERARDDGAEVFDFTIGGEAFKMRFATSVPHVFDLHLTDSLVSASVKRARQRLGALLRR